MDVICGMTALGIAFGVLIGAMVGYQKGWSHGYDDGLAASRRKLTGEQAARSVP